ncbi:hypothetical protein [Halosimplex sp. J119]
MDDPAALRRTLRRCTAVLILTVVPALRPISDYQYDGTLAVVVALGYLLVSTAVQLEDRSRSGSGPDLEPDDESDAERGAETDD